MTVGDWNTLKVRVEKGSFTCFLNGEAVATIEDDEFTSGRVGLAKFRETEAEFKQFAVAKQLAVAKADPEQLQRWKSAIEELPSLEKLTAEKLARFDSDAKPAAGGLRERAAELERRAVELRLMAADVQTRDVATRLGKLVQQNDDFDLLRATLLVAQLDDDELEVDNYVEQVERMAREIKQALPEGADEAARRAAIGASLEERFTRLMTLLKINGTAAAVKQFVGVPQVPLKLDSEIKAAAGIITADERKAEGLAD